ncbi:MAG TPA: hypothetical protein VII01_13425, partial [Solirubrobacteraceae bacterium]
SPDPAIERCVFMLSFGCRLRHRRTRVPCSARRVRPAARRRGAGRPARRSGSRAGASDSEGESSEPGEARYVEPYDNGVETRVERSVLPETPAALEFVGISAALSARAEWAGVSGMSALALAALVAFTWAEYGVLLAAGVVVGAMLGALHANLATTTHAHSGHKTPTGPSTASPAQPLGQRRNQRRAAA